jgi:WD40 repeat protein
VQALAAAAQVPLPSGGDATTLRPDAPALTALPAEAPRKRRRWPWLAAAGLLLALLTGGGLALRSVLHRHDALPDPAATTRQAAGSTGSTAAPTKLEPKGITGVAFTPDGQIVSVGEEGAVWTWSSPKEEPGPVHPQTAKKLHDIASAKSMVLSPDGRRFLTDAGGAVDLWDVQTGTQRRSVALPLPQDTVFQTHFVIHSKAFSPDGRHFIVDCTGNRPFESSRHLLIGDLDGKTRPLPGSDVLETVCVAVSSDGKKALTAGRDAVRLWSVEPTAPAQKIDRGGVISMAFAPDGKQCLLGEEFDTLVLVDADSGKEVHSLVGHGGGVSCVAFSADGKQALSGGWDKTVRLWDVEAGKQLECFRGHQAEVTGVAFAPDGTKAVSGSKDGAVFLWKLPAGGGK